MPHQRIAAHDRQVHGLEAIHHAENAINQRLSLKVAEIAQVDTTTQVGVVVGITAGTAERTLARDLD